MALSAKDIDKGTPRARAEARRLAQLAAARARTEAFIEYALPHERTGKPVKNAPFHEEWQQAFREHRFVVLVAPVEHGKSQQSVGKLLHKIGTNPEERGAIISNSAASAEKLLNQVRQHIEHNPRVQEVFPHLEPSSRPGDPWGQQAITVERETIAKDPTIQAVGYGGPIVGSRLDWVLIDDALDFDNTRTKEQRAKLLDWFDSTLWQRLTEGASCWVIGTPWHPDDLLHVLAARPDWVGRWYSAVENPDDPPEQWRPIWFSLERILERWRNTTPHNFARKLLCRARSDVTARFKRAWIHICKRLGKGRDLLEVAPTTPSGKRLPCFTGVDLGIGQEEEHDLTCFFTIAVDDRKRRIIVDVRSGRWTGPEILTQLVDVQRRFDSIVTVESVAAQRYILQFAAHLHGLGVRPFNTTAGAKYDEHFGLESMGVEMRAGLWVIPSGRSGEQVADELQQWIQELLDYRPESHVGDRLMASWFARESARSFLHGITDDSLDTVSR